MAARRSSFIQHRWASTWRAISLAVLAVEASACVAQPDPGRVFDRAWAMTGDLYWDPHLKGVDWDAARDRYRPQAVAAKDDAGLYRAINAMLGTLHDSHSFALSPEERAAPGPGDDADAAAGFGLSVAPDEGRWLVESVVPDGPAARAGVEIGWVLDAIDGQPPDGARQFGAGDRATLGFRDDAGRRRDIPLVGVDLPPEPPRRTTLLPGGVLLLAFDDFDPGTDCWIAGEIAGARPKGLILDLRENDGGRSDVLDRVAGLFFGEKRAVLRLMRRRETVENTIGAGRDTWTGPLVLLIGPRSASAAEALAAMIAEAGRGVTVGQRTAGALTGATDHRLPDGGMLSIPEYDVRTPGGARLEGRGLDPRHVVVPSLAERRRGEDPAAECARRLALGAPCGRGEKDASTS